MDGHPASPEQSSSGGPEPSTVQPEPSTGRSQKRQSAGARRFGYAVAIAVNALLIYLIYVQPGWRVVPFLTEEARHVMPVIVMSLLVSIAVNLIWLAYDPLWLRSLGELVTTAIGVVVIARILTVYPFTFVGDPPWDTGARVVLIVGLIGSSIGVIVHLVALVRRLAGLEEANDNVAGGQH